MKKLELNPVIPSQHFCIDEKDVDFLYYAFCGENVTATFLKDKVIISIEYISENYPSWTVYALRPNKVCANLKALHEQGWTIRLKGIRYQDTRVGLRVPETDYRKIETKIDKANSKG